MAVAGAVSFPMPSFRDLYRSGLLSQYLLCLACLAGVVGLLAARALVSLSPLVGVLAVLANPNLRRDLPNYPRNGAAMRAAAMYVLFVASGFYTSSWPEWRHETFRLLPWIGVPLVFALAVPLSGKQRVAVGSFFVLGTTAIALATLGRFLSNPAAAIEAIHLGQSMPSVTRIFHIHFGVMLGLAFFFALRLRREQRVGPVLRIALLVAAAAIAFTLHALAYRTGLLVFYVVLLTEAVRLVMHRRVALGAVLLLALAAAPWVGYHTVEPIRLRWRSTYWDVERFVRGQDINETSLARRLAAWETAGQIIREHPVLGVGPADAYAAMMEQYSWRDFGLRPANRAMVHNQYLHYLVGSGAVGLLLWLALLLWPLMQPTRARNPYIRQFVLILGTAMLVDSLLELQIGFNLFVFGYGFLVVADERRRRHFGRLPAPLAPPKLS